MNILQKIRITFAIVAGIAITILFFDFTGTIYDYLGLLAKVQFLPALLAVNMAVIIGLVLLTLLFGRVYCSVICPLGVFQDLVSKFNRKKNKFQSSKSGTWLQYGILVILIIAFIANMGFLVVLFEPYVAYGRMVSNLVAPIYLFGNNGLALVAEKVDSYAFYHVDVWIKGIGTLVTAIIILIIIVFLAWKNGRIYCNTICPVGTILGFLSTFSIYKRRVDIEHCNSCGLCARNCKLSCIDPKKHTIGYSRCVSCFNCIDKCSKGAITYFLPKCKKVEVTKNTSEINYSLRQIFIAAGLLVATSVAKAQMYKLMKPTFFTLLFTTLCSTVISQEIFKDTLSISEVVVTGTRNAVDVRHLPMSVSVINQQQIERRYEPSLLPLLTEQVPGLFTTARGILGYGVANGGSGGMSMRGIGGSPTTGMLVLIDGHPQYMGLMGHPIADAYQSMFAEKVEVVRGPASVLYGSNAMGGVINILTNKLQKNGFYNHIGVAYGSFNTLTTEASSRFRHNKISATITGSYNRTDGHRERMDFEQYGGYAKVGYDFSQHWNLFADLNITHFNASNPGAVERPIYENDSRITRGMTSLSLENNYDRTSGAFKFFYNWGKHNINDGYYDGGTSRSFLFNSQDNMFGITLYQSVQLFTGNRLTAGFDYQQFGGKAWNANNDGTNTDIADKTENNVAGYLDFRQSLGRIITLDAGLRFDHHSVTGNYLIPQFGASIYPMKTGEIKLLASRGFRNPTIREMYMFPPQNPNLQSESLWSYELSWSQRLLQGKVTYGVNLFYINGKNMIQTVPVEGRPMNINTGKVENWGIEVSASYRINTMFYLSANYSYLNMKYAIIAAPEHKLYAGLNFTKDRWTAATGLQHVNGLYTSIAATGTTQENFLLWNIRGSFRVFKWLDLYIKSENLLNQKYAINLGFPMPGITVMGGINVTLDM